jgi:hypothetical protein
MELYNSEYLTLKSFGYGIYISEFMCLAKNNKISKIDMQTKIMDIIGLNIEEVIISSTLTNRAFIMTTDGFPTSDMEKRQIDSIELVGLDGVMLLASKKFVERSKLIFQAFGIEHKFLFSVI